MLVDLYIPCFIDQLFPNTSFDVVRTLEAAGVQVNYNPKQTCCGQPFYNSGYWNYSKKHANKFLNNYKADNPIVIPSASCAGYIKNHFPKLFEKEEFENKDGNRIISNVVEYTDFLINHLNISDFNASFPHKSTYHDGCAALREYKLNGEPRILLNKVKGLELLEMEDCTSCCGFGGTFMINFVAISTAMAEQKVEMALKTGAEYIVSTEASCLINIDSYIKKQKLPIKTLHIANILSQF